MFQEDQRLTNVALKIQYKDKIQNLNIDLQLSYAGEINLNELLSILRSLEAIQQNQIIFYFDYSQNLYTKINDDNFQIPYTSLIRQNLISIRCQSLMSDEVLANPLIDHQQRKQKRNREKSIQEAFYLVYQWRLLYRQGIYDEKGALIKINLDQCAEMISIPRKTLEDYYLLFRNGKNKKFDFKKQKKQKIGALRKYLKETGKPKEQQKQFFNQEHFFKQMKSKFFSQKMEEEIQKQLFSVLEDRNASSDEDLIFQN